MKKVVWVISDGVAGHYNQSKGCVLALEQLFEVQVEWVELTLRFGLLRKGLQYLLNQHGQISLSVLQWCYQCTDWPQTAPDLVIGAGGKVMYAVAALARLHGVPSIFMGSLRGLNPALFHTVLVLEQYPEPQYLTVETAPMPVSPQALSAAAEAWQAEHPTETGELWAMLIGGDGAGAHYSEQDWQQLAIAMNHLAQEHHIRWLITTSRRTGSAAEEMLKHTLYPDVVADQVWWSEAPRKVMAAFLGRAQLVCCTVESMSMLTEAIVAQRPVMGLIPQQFSPESAYQQALYRLMNRRWLATQPIDTWAAQHFAQQQQLKPMRQSALNQLAHQLNTRLMNDL